MSQTILQHECDNGHAWKTQVYVTSSGFIYRALAEMLCPQCQRIGVIPTRYLKTMRPIMRQVCRSCATMYTLPMQTVRVTYASGMQAMAWRLKDPNARLHLLYCAHCLPRMKRENS